MTSRVKTALQPVFRYKSLLTGIVIIVVFIARSIYAIVAIPYDDAIKAWNTLDHWEDHPKLAYPAWVNNFLTKKLPETIVLDSRAEGIKVRQPIPFGGGVYIKIEI
ncbi:MAG: hypothetical protein QXP80_07030, partial [Zestosphaera sp.]